MIATGSPPTLTMSNLAVSPADALWMMPSAALVVLQIGDADHRMFAPVGGPRKAVRVLIGDRPPCSEPVAGAACDQLSRWD